MSQIPIGEHEFQCRAEGMVSSTCSSSVRSSRIARKSALHSSSGAQSALGAGPTVSDRVGDRLATQRSCRLRREKRSATTPLVC